MSEQLKKSKKVKLKNQTLSRSDLHARIYPLLEKGKASKGKEADSFLKQLESSANSSPVCLSLKTSKDFSPVTRAKTLKSYCERLPTLGYMTANGNCLILPGFYPKTESESTLSDLLEEKPDPKHFLSKKSTKRILKAAKTSKNVAFLLQ